MKSAPLYKSWRNAAIDEIHKASSSDSNIETDPRSQGDGL